MKLDIEIENAQRSVRFLGLTRVLYAAARVRFLRAFCPSFPARRI